VETSTENQTLQKESVMEDKAQDKSQSRLGKKGKKTTELDVNTFGPELLNLINRMRANPADFAKIIENHKKFIRNKDGKLAYMNQGSSSSLQKGEEAFTSCINILNNTSSLSPLTISELRVEVPDDPEIQLKNSQPLLKELKERNVGKTIALNYDVGPLIPENVLVLMLVDDLKNNGARRNNLISEKHTNLGVSINKGKKAFYYFPYIFLLNKLI